MFSPAARTSMMTTSSTARTRESKRRPELRRRALAQWLAESVRLAPSVAVAVAGVVRAERVHLPAAEHRKAATTKSDKLETTRPRQERGFVAYVCKFSDDVHLTLSMGVGWRTSAERRGGTGGGRFCC